MRIALAYFSIILLWATTPLAIKWSGDGPGFILGAGSRMTIGLSCMLLFLLIRGKRLPKQKKALKTFFAVSIQMYGAMLSVYWAAQYVPSGWISVIFGLSPFLTALFAAIWLKERSLTFGKVCAYFLGLGGLSLMFSSAIQLNIQAVYGIIGVLTAVSLQTATAVWVKRIDAKLPASTQVTGGLFFAFPAYLLTWLCFDNAYIPQDLSQLNIASILYLGIIATTIGFVLYYYVLIHLSATTVGFIPLISPVLALYIGHSLNNEALTIKVISGTALILSALLMHEFFDRYIIAMFSKSQVSKNQAKNK